MHGRFLFLSFCTSSLRSPPLGERDGSRSSSGKTHYSSFGRKVSVRTEQGRNGLALSTFSSYHFSPSSESLSTSSQTRHYLLSFSLFIVVLCTEDDEEPNLC